METIQDITEITPLELHKLLAHEPADWQLLDVREQHEFDSGHLSGSILIPLKQVPYHYDTLNREKKTVVLCLHGIRSRMAINYLSQIGFERIYNLCGGIKAWWEQFPPQDAECPNTPPIVP